MLWSKILERSAALLNDQVRANFTDEVLLPYLNIAKSELQEIFELNNIPVTAKTSEVINVAAGVTRIGFDTDPHLPTDLIEIQELFNSLEDQNTWIPVDKVDYLTLSSMINNAPVAYFGVWAWKDQSCHFLESNSDLDIKLDYIKSLFVDLEEGELNNNNTIINTDTFFQYRTAAIAAEFIDENTSRSEGLNNYAGKALERSLGISVKGMQPIAFRRRPFRASYKARRIIP